MVLPARNEALRHDSSAPPLQVISASTRRFLWRRVGVYKCELVCMQIADISEVMGVLVQMETLHPSREQTYQQSQLLGTGHTGAVRW